MGRYFGRVIWIVLDSLGIGALPDAAAYDGNADADTLGHIAAQRPLRLPALTRLGMANIRSFRHLDPAARPAGCFGRCALASPGKDTTTGHWEMAGIHLDKPFPLYPGGFPPSIIRAFEQRIGRSILGNVAASGTEIIERLGREHLRTGRPIVYTSADSVFQVAAHEAVIPLAELYAMCDTARALLTGEHEVGRVIARPFRGEPGRFERTADRRDWAVAPPRPMLLDELALRQVPVYAVGKIADIFLDRGIARKQKTRNNDDGMRCTLDAMADQPDGLIFVNLVDFDQQYGHRNDVEGYAAALETFDRWLCGLSLRPDDLLLITADHGCDPTTPSTDHTREYVPLLAYGPRVPPGVDLGTRATLADTGQTVAENFDARLPHGVSFLAQISVKEPRN